jgi:hypothetical protein
VLKIFATLIATTALDGAGKRCDIVLKSARALLAQKLSTLIAPSATKAVTPRWMIALIMDYSLDKLILLSPVYRSL